MLSFPPSKTLLKGEQCGGSGCSGHRGSGVASSGSVISKGPSLSSSLRNRISSKKAFKDAKLRIEPAFFFFFFLAFAPRSAKHPRKSTWRSQGGPGLSARWLIGYRVGKRRRGRGRYYGHCKWPQGGEERPRRAPGRAPAPAPERQQRALGERRCGLPRPCGEGSRSRTGLPELGVARGCPGLSPGSVCWVADDRTPSRCLRAAVLSPQSTASVLLAGNGTECHLQVSVLSSCRTQCTPRLWFISALSRLAHLERYSFEGSAFRCFCLDRIFYTFFYKGGWIKGKGKVYLGRKTHGSPM